MNNEPKTDLERKAWGRVRKLEVSYKDLQTENDALRIELNELRKLYEDLKLSVINRDK